MKTIRVELPVLIEVAGIGESEADHYMSEVLNFLQNFETKKVKAEFLGYLDNLAVIAFYTNRSDPRLRSDIRKLKESQRKEEQENEDDSVCHECGKEW